MVSLEQIQTMVGLEQIQIIYYIRAIIITIFTILAYIKNLFGLKIKVNRLVCYIKQFFEFVQLFPRLWVISNENSDGYEKMIDFKIYQSSIIASNSGSPYIDLYFYISNRSIFDFKIKKIFMEIYDNGSYAGKIETSNEFDLFHQQTKSNNLKSDLLNINFENYGSFPLMISPARININSI